MILRFFWLSLAFFGLVAGTISAHAHRGHQMLSVVEIDQVTGAVTVTHRFSAHDIEPLLLDIDPKAVPSIDDPGSEAILIDHIRSHFALAETPLEYAGSDHRGDALSYRFTGQLPDKFKAIRIRSSLFFNTGRVRSNRIVIRHGDHVRTITTTPDATTIKYISDLEHGKPS